jgi:hypothetical protein
MRLGVVKTLPKQFCMPVHLSAAAAPASVCANAKILGPQKPKPQPITIMPASLVAMGKY